MTAIKSTTDSLLVAIPMVFLLFAGFFRLDELVARRPKAPEQGRKLSDWDENGMPLCVEPDGIVSARAHRKG